MILVFMALCQDRNRNIVNISNPTNAYERNALRLWLHCEPSLHHRFVSFTQAHVKRNDTKDNL